MHLANLKSFKFFFFAVANRQPKRGLTGSSSTVPLETRMMIAIWRYATEPLTKTCTKSFHPRLHPVRQRVVRNPQNFTPEHGQRLKMMPEFCALVYCVLHAHLNFDDIKPKWYEICALMLSCQMTLGVYQRSPDLIYAFSPSSIGGNEGDARLLGHVL